MILITTSSREINIVKGVGLLFKGKKVLRVTNTELTN